jgi:RNA polymerase sigma-70 factor, ECF subfamily
MARAATAIQADAEIHQHLHTKQYREALALLLPKYRHKVFRFCFGMLGDRALAEDVTQDVFFRVWRALPGYEAQAALSTWIYAISKNACLSELRKRKPMISIHADEEYDPEVTSLAARDRDDSATVSVSQVLDRLPERYRRAVSLFYMEDQSYEQTAASLGLPLGTVKALLHRARKRLIELTQQTAQRAEAS